jgi:K+-transporting ATPase ATPase C chain
LIYKDKVIVGSSLIAEEFKSDKYFYSRFSAVNYNGANSGASDLAPSSKELTTNTAKNITKIRFLNGISENVPLPADMVLASGSGLDPHISIENALLQAKRVAKVRNISEQKVKNLIMQNIDNDFIGIWGKSAVNVLRLNIALDNIYE